MLSWAAEGEISGWKAIVGCPSVGNVGQLAVESLIYSVGAQKRETVWDLAVVPIIGPNPFSSDGTCCSSCEVYTSEEDRLIVIQLRTPLRPGSGFKFWCSLADRLKNLGVESVIVPSGAFPGASAVTRTGLQAAFGDDTISWSEAGWPVVDPKTELNGCGAPLRLLKACRSVSLNCTLLLHFCFEGDNLTDSLNLLRRADQRLNLFKSSVGRRSQGPIMPPHSGLMSGNPAPQSVF